MVRLVVLLTLLLVSCSDLHAQRFARRFFTGHWIGDLYLLDHIGVSGSEAVLKKVLIDDDNVIHPTLPEMKTPIDFQAPKEYGNRVTSVYWHNGALYALAYTLGLFEENEDGSRFMRYHFVKWQDGGWHFLGDYKINQRQYTALAFIPCDNDRFIVVSTINDLTYNNGSERTPFFRMSITPGKSEIRLDSPIDHGMDKLRGHMSDTSFFRSVTNNLIHVKTDKHAVLIHNLTGLYWVFSLERASLIRTGSIFNIEVTPEIISKLGFMDAILSIHPEKDGTVLLSAQEEAAFTTEIGNTSVDIMNKILTENSELSEQEAMKVLDDHMKEFAKRNPLLVWYRIYPESGGRVEKLGTPPIGGAYRRVDEEGDNINDEWRPLSDGSVRMGPITFGRKVEADEVRQNNSDDGERKNQIDYKSDSKTSK